MPARWQLRHDKNARDGPEFALVWGGMPFDLNSNTLFASLFWGAIGLGMSLYGWKQKSGHPTRLRHRDGGDLLFHLVGPVDVGCQRGRSCGYVLVEKARLLIAFNHGPTRMNTDDGRHKSKTIFNTRDARCSRHSCGRLQDIAATSAGCRKIKPGGRIQPCENSEAGF